MKKFIEKIVDGLPYTVLTIIFFAVIIFINKHGLLYDQLLGLIGILIWPTIVLSALIFFRKVFTYLFFSMEEFNFFGNKGSLKNIQEVIEERVKIRLEAEQKEKESQLAVNQIADELEKARLSQKDSDEKARVNLGIANEIFEKYKALFDENNKLVKELSVFQREKAERVARTVALREKIRRIRERRNRIDNEPSQEEVDAAGEEYIQRKHDEERGK